MATLTVRNLDDQLKAKLRVRAAHNGRSMEDEARTILRQALGSAPAETAGLAERIRRRFEPLGGVDLEIAPREPVREPPVLAARRPRR